VRVRFVLKNGAIQNGEFLLSPQGGLEGHIRRDTAHAGASTTKSLDKVLVPSNMDVGVAQLQLLMEAALAGLQEAAAPITLVAEPSPTVDSKGNKGKGKNSQNVSCTIISH